MPLRLASGKPRLPSLRDSGDLFRIYQRHASEHGWRAEVEGVSEGEALDDVINPLIAEDQAARLASLEESLG